MSHALTTQPSRDRGYRVRELVCTYRPLRDPDGQVVALSTSHLTNPRTAAKALAPLLADHTVEVFGVACLSTKNRLLAWHVLSRGTRTSTPVSIPEVFVPACLTPGTTGLMVVHNHPSGDPTPSTQDIRLTRDLVDAGRHMKITVHDHVVVGAQGRTSMRAMGLL